MSNKREMSETKKCIYVRVHVLDKKLFFHVEKKQNKKLALIKLQKKSK